MFTNNHSFKIISMISLHGTSTVLIRVDKMTLKITKLALKSEWYVLNHQLLGNLHSILKQNVAKANSRKFERLRIGRVAKMNSCKTEWCSPNNELFSTK